MQQLTRVNYEHKVSEILATYFGRFSLFFFRKMYKCLIPRAQLDIEELQEM